MCSDSAMSFFGHILTVKMSSTDQVRSAGGTGWSSRTREKSTHYPDAVVDDPAELKSLAQRVCKTWWNRLRKVNREFDYGEVERIYTRTFIAAYTKGVDAETPYEVKEARKKHIAQTGGATVTVENVRYFDDRAIYELKLTDGLYLRTADKSTAFEVHLDRNGNIVQSELAEQ
jgi:hypothetical protein